MLALHLSHDWLNKKLSDLHAKRPHVLMTVLKQRTTKEIFQEGDNEILFIFNCSNVKLTECGTMCPQTFYDVVPVDCLPVPAQDEIYPVSAKEVPQVFDGSLTEVIWWIAKFFQTMNLQVCNSSWCKWSPCEHRLLSSNAAVNEAGP